MTLDEFLSTKSNPDEIAQWMTQNMKYFEASNTDVNLKQQLASDPDLAKTWACELVEGKNAVCTNFAALPVVAARKQGIPTGMIYQKKAGKDMGHEYGWWLRPDGTVGVISAGSQKEMGTGSYNSFDEMVSAFKDTRKQGDTIYFQDATGNHLLDQSTENSWLAQSAGDIQKMLGTAPMKKGGTVTEAERERFTSTVFKNL